MNLVTLSPNNLDSEHICCTLSGKHSAEIKNRKNWLKKHIPEGVVFKKLPIRGKAFIEYVPAERAWRPVIAGGYMFIHCLWVSGRFKGQGNGVVLLNECIKAAEGMNGIAVVTSGKSFLTDKSFFLRHGFEICDTAPPYFELLTLKFKQKAETPRFTAVAKSLTTNENEDLVIYYSEQCPYFGTNAMQMRAVAENQGLSVRLIKYETAEEAQSSPCAYGVFATFLKGKFLTHKPYTAEQFEKLLNRQEVL